MQILSVHRSSFKYVIVFVFLFQPIVRQKKHFNSLHIPKALQKALPFKSKPKTQAKAGKTPKDRVRPAVIREPHERKVLSMDGFQYFAFRCENHAVSNTLGVLTAFSLYMRKG